MKRLILLLVIAAIGITAYLYIYKPEAPQTSSVSSDAVRSNPIVEVTSTVAFNLVKKKSESELKYDTVDDLSLIADEIKSKAEAGDAVSQRLYGKMLQECQNYSVTRKTFKADLDALSKVMPQAGNMYEKIGVVREKRCKNFTGDSLIAEKEPYLWYGQAALKNDAQSMAKVLSGMGLTNLNDAALKDSLDMIIASKDPEAYMEVANIMNESNQSRSNVLGEFSGSARNELAWRLAACRLGANCSSKSPLLINYCLYGGARSACNGSTLEVVIRTDMLSPAEYETTLNSSTSLINSLKKP